MIHINMKMLVNNVIQPVYRKVKINNPGLHKSYTKIMIITHFINYVIPTP